MALSRACKSPALSAAVLRSGHGVAGLDAAPCANAAPAAGPPSPARSPAALPAAACAWGMRGWRSQVGPPPCSSWQRRGHLARASHVVRVSSVRKRHGGGQQYRTELVNKALDAPPSRRLLHACAQSAHILSRSAPTCVRASVRACTHARPNHTQSAERIVHGLRVLRLDPACRAACSAIIGHRSGCSSCDRGKGGRKGGPAAGGTARLRGSGRCWARCAACSWGSAARLVPPSPPPQCPAAPAV